MMEEIIGKPRRVRKLPLLGVVAVLMAQAAWEGHTACANISGDAIISATAKRALHRLPYEHTHLWQMTETPTQISDDNEYYTDDVIDEDMMREKKDLYRQEQTNGSDPLNVASALESERSSASRDRDARWGLRGKGLLVGGINAILAWSFFFW